MTGGAWTAVVLAGDRPGENDFALSNGVVTKALIPVGGLPMLGRVVRTLLECPSVGRIVILAQQPERLATGELEWLGSEPGVEFARSESGISMSIAAIAGSDRAPWPVLVTTADHPLLTGSMIDIFLRGSGHRDIAFALVERGTIEASHPESRRTWLRFSDGDYSGANLFALRGDKARAALELWSSVEQDRKKVRRIVTRFGPLLALRVLTRTIPLDSAIAKAGARLGLSAQAVRLPFAEAAMDVDKPSDLVLAERILAQRAAV